MTLEWSSGLSHTKQQIFEPFRVLGAVGEGQKADAFIVVWCQDPLGVPQMLTKIAKTGETEDERSRISGENV